MGRHEHRSESFSRTQSVELDHSNAHAGQEVNIKAKQVNRYEVNALLQEKKNPAGCKMFQNLKKKESIA